LPNSVAIIAPLIGNYFTRNRKRKKIKIRFSL